MTASCECCKKNTPKTGPRICPICGHIFGGNGWDGIDAHWRAKHQRSQRYEDFWGGFCRDHRGQGGAS